MKMIRALESI